MTEAERLAANSRPTLIDIVDMIARQHQCSLKEASEYLAEAVKGLDVGNSRHTIEWQPIETAPRDGSDVIVMYKHNDTQIVHNAFWMDGDDDDPGQAGWWSYVHSEASRTKLDEWWTPTHWTPLLEPSK